MAFTRRVAALAGAGVTVAVALGFWATGTEPETSGVGAEGTRATVVRVVDGDTVDMRLASGAVERVRILGIDTPEVVDPRRPAQCFGAEASARLKSLLPPGRSTRLVGDPTQDARDQYGRRLAHVFLDGATGTVEDGTNVGRALIEGGFARHYVYQRTPTVHGREYASAQATARAGGAGLWSAATCDGRTTPVR